MQVTLKFPLRCAPDSAWQALHTPAVGFQLYGPIIQVRSVDPLPARWQAGDQATIALKLLGVFPLGTQHIRISNYESQAAGQPVRIMRDHGEPFTGPLSLLATWDHQMGVSAVPGKSNRTIWHEQLTIGGVFAPAFYPVLWIIWQLRARRLRHLAKSW